MLKLRNLPVAAVVVALSTFGFRCVAQPALGWVYLGDAHVDGAVDHDTIKVTGARGQFRAIRMQVQYGAIEFHRVIIHYGDGASARVPVRARIAAGRQTGAIP